MTTPLEKIAEEKTGNYQSSLKGGGGGVPHIGKRPIYFRFFLLKASLSGQKNDRFIEHNFLGTRMVINSVQIVIVNHTY